MAQLDAFLHEQAESISSQPTGKSLPTLRFQKNGNGQRIMHLRTGALAAYNVILTRLPKTGLPLPLWRHLLLLLALCLMHY